ncbi:hypothetical protein [Nocardioides stalactiti]|uniref:hypothetical protein n=1 Tax=Nocardioides stalactiti TaxID=2755356 RepID=UPI0016044D37|nr:hypothetical protein [Nocardioides stalactiti]
MSTGSTDRPGRRLRIFAALLTALVALASLTACGEDESPVTSDPTDRDAIASIEKTLRQRARAVRDRDPVRFTATLGQRDDAFVAEQEGYLDNLDQLPLATYRITLVDDSLKRAGRSYWAEVLVRTQLQGYDVAPVVTRDRWRFTPTRDGRRYLVSSTRDAGWEAGHDTQPQPWDLGPIEVREAPGVLGIFDATTLPLADEVLSAVSQSRFEVKSILPDTLEDPGGVVVSTLSDLAFLESLDGLPTAPADLDALTVPVPRDAERPEGPVASYRVVLSPDVLDEGEQVVDRLVRHELTHVALGDHARRAPLWLDEGLAEYVSVRPLAPVQRPLQTDALDLVATGVNDLPPDEAFGGADAEGWYGVAWWVCEYVAATYGEDALWALVDGFAAGRDEQAVVFDTLGVTTSELAQAGIALMRSTYG